MRLSAWPWLRDLLCLLFDHDAEPIEGVGWSADGKEYHKFYTCRRCCRTLKWIEDDLDYDNFGHWEIAE